VRILITGASSSLAVAVTRRLLVASDVEIWCGRHRAQVPVADPRLHILDLDLESDLNSALSGLSFDKVIHFAALTHSVDERRYWTLNVEATTQLARAVYQNGCRDFVYISTRCATEHAGAYGESKLAAERELQRLDWRSLLIIRPAEVYGANSHEGIDRMLAVAHKWRIVPALFGNSNLLFAPLHIDDFGRVAADLIRRHRDGISIEHLCGPEDLTGVMLARRVSQFCGALPLPLWWPVVAVCLKTVQKLGFSQVKPDQLKRLIAKKTANADSSQTHGGDLRRFLLQ